MRPGDSAQTLSGVFNNPNDGPIYVATVTASISSVTKAAGAPAGSCGHRLRARRCDHDRRTRSRLRVGVDACTGATLKFNNKATAQDACKGATVNLAYTIA